MGENIKQKLDLLLKIQEIDSNIDAIERLKGELPEELEELKKECAISEDKMSSLNADIKTIKNEVSKLKINVHEATELIQRYSLQQKEIKSNREFNALTKEIDLQKLEVKLMEKKIKELKADVKEKETNLKEYDDSIKKQKKEIKIKSKELNQISEENEKLEEDLIAERNRLKANIDADLVQSYNNLRGSLRNKLAVVKISREACGGCFNLVTPQRQVDVRSKSKIIICEHCGRILADVDEPIEIDQ